MTGSAAAPALPSPCERDSCFGDLSCRSCSTEAQKHNYIELWFWSGLRTSEINGLEWRYVDFKDNTIAIERVLVAGEEKNRTKTAEARLVRLNSRSRAALLRQRAFTQVAGGRVFQDPRTGKPWHSEEAFQRVYWTRMLKRLGIRYRRPYNMRHSYATSMLMAGMTPAFCARQLGHTVEMFLRTYAKWIDGSQNDLEMARLENALTVDEAGPAGARLAPRFLGCRHRAVAQAREAETAPSG